MNQRPFYRLHSILMLIVFIVSCSSSSTDPETDFPEIQGFDVELAEETSYIESSVADAIIKRADEETGIYYFDASAAGDTNIRFEVGEILFIEQGALLKITSVSERNGEIVVQTEPAMVNEVFRNAEISLEQQITFDLNTLQKTQVEYMGKVFDPLTTSTNTVKWTGKVGDFEFEIEATPGGSELGLAMLVKYDTGQVSGAFRTGVTLDSFTQQVDLNIVEQQTTLFRANTADFSGTLELLMILAGGNSEGQWQHAPDFPRMRFPIPGVPLLFQLELGTVFVTSFDLGINGTSRFETTYSYSGEMGFEFDGSRPRPFIRGNLGEPQVSDGIGNAAGFSGTVSGQYGVALPNLGVLVATVPAAYIRQEFYVGALYSFPTCTEIYSRYVLKAGMSLVGNLGFNLNIANPEQTFVDRRMHESKSDGCAPGKLFENDWISISGGYAPEDPGVPLRVSIE